MNTWMSMARFLFEPSPLLFGIVSVFFIVPTLALLLAFQAWRGKFIFYFFSLLGRWDMAVRWLRNSLGLFFLGSGAVWYAAEHIFYLSGTCVLLLVLLIVQNHFRQKNLVAWLTFIQRHPDIHPQEAFDHYFCCVSGIRYRFPSHPFRSLDFMNIDFRVTTWHDEAMSPLITGVWSTAVLARLLLLAQAKCRKESFEIVIRTIPVIWGTRLLQLAKVQLTVKGTEKLRNLPSAHIFTFNHTSIYDFVATPLLGALLWHEQKALMELPRYLLARDHFLKNPVVYWVLGVGRVAEAMQMVFVERQKTSPETAQQAVRDAAHAMTEKGLPIALFPQGTRARSTVDAKGMRKGAAYYATGKFERLTREGAHIKKGAARIAVEVAQKTPVAIVPVALLGAARTLPRKSLQLLLGETIEVRIGEIISVKSSAKVEDVHRAIDLALVDLVGIHADLERRFFEDTRPLLNAHQHEELAVAMKAWRGDDRLIFVILDYIYAASLKHWKPQLFALAHLLINVASREQLVALKLKAAKFL